METTIIPDVKEFVDRRNAAREAAEAMIKKSGLQPLNTMPAGWWQIGAKHPAHRGVKQAVIDGLNADTKIPEHWRNAMVVAISKFEATAIEIHAHGQDDEKGGRKNLHFEIKKLF